MHLLSDNGIPICFKACFAGAIRSPLSHIFIGMAVTKQHVFHVHISPGPPPPPPHPPPHPPRHRLFIIRPPPPPPPARSSSSSIFPGSIPGLILIILLILLLILRLDPRPHPPPPPSSLDLASFPRLTVDSFHCAFSPIALLYII